MHYEDMELANFKNILNSIDLGPLSRADIAKKLDLSRTTVSKTINKLIQAQVLKEGGNCAEVLSSPGRPGQKLMYDDKWYALGASFYLSSWYYVICDLSGKIVFEKKEALKDITPESLIKSLIKGLKSVIKSFDGKLLPAVGLGLPGIVDSDHCQILYAYDLKWYDPIDVRTPVEKALKMKIYCLNRYSLAGLAEFTYENKEAIKNYVYIGLGSGIRSAIFIDGKLMKGNSFSSGRLAHIVVAPNGPLCECGKHGCLLAVANEMALIDYAQKARSSKNFRDSMLSKMQDNQITAELILKLADQNDPCAQECVTFITKYLTHAVAMLVDIINPRRIVIGGPMGYSCSYLVSEIKKHIPLLASEASYKSMDIVQGKLKEIGSALGAATLVLEHKADLLFDYVDKLN